MRMQSRKGREDPEINLIPLIDVSLLLVIFFMLSSTFMQEARLKIELPQASLAPASEEALARTTYRTTTSGSTGSGRRPADPRANRPRP